MTSALEKTSARPATPLFQVHPSGGPSIIHIKRGLPSSCAFLRASDRLVCQGISIHRSVSPEGATAECSFANCSRLRLPVAKLGTEVPFSVHAPGEAWPTKIGEITADLAANKAVISIEFISRILGHSH